MDFDLLDLVDLFDLVEFGGDSDYYLRSIVFAVTGIFIYAE